MARRARGLRIGVAVGSCALLTLPCAVASAGVPVTVSVSEQVIRITPRYRGELVRVEGTAPEDCDVVVKLTSAREDAQYSLKGKVGPLWLSVGQVRFGNVPRMYKVKSTGAIDDLLPAAEQVEHRLGRRGLKASIRVPPGLDRGVYLDELIRIRQHVRFFDFGDDSVHRQGTRFSTSFFWPPDGPPGSYRVQAYAIERGRVVGSAETSVLVRIVGVEAWVRHLATAHGILYGLVAVAIALVAGLLASFGLPSAARRKEQPPVEPGA